MAAFNFVLKKHDYFIFSNSIQNSAIMIIYDAYV